MSEEYQEQKFWPIIVLYFLGIFLGVLIAYGVWFMEW